MQLFKVSELKAILRLSESQIYNIIQSGKLRCYRFTSSRQGGIRVSREQLDAYLHEAENEPGAGEAPVALRDIRHASG